MAAIVAFVIAAATAPVVGEIAAVVGLITTPIFLTSASIGLSGAGRPQQPKQGINVRFWAGISNSSDPKGEDLGGNIPSIAFWGPNGNPDGHLKSSGRKVTAGGFLTMHVPTETNVRPEYVAVAAQEHDEICLAGMALAIHDTPNPLMLLGDTLAACGTPWYQSLVKVGDSDTAPLCVWLDGSHGPRTDLQQGYTRGDIALAPDGFSMRIADFTGSVVNDAVIKQRSEDNRLICEHPARLKIWNEMRGKIKIPIFAERPVPKNKDETDLPDFLTFKSEESHPQHHMLGKRDGSEQVDEAEQKAKEARRNLLFHGTLVKGPQTAEFLCSSPTSHGPDWYSHEAHNFCHMSTKTLLPGCSAEVTDDCFDAETHEVRQKKCPPGRRCVRAAANVPEKEYTRVWDTRDL